MHFNAHQSISFIRHFFTAKRKGHGIHSPFAYQLCEEVFYNNNALYSFPRLQQLRRQLLSNDAVIEVNDHGAGSKTFTGNTRKVSDIASKGISSQKQSEILARLIHLLQCQGCLELGTSLGLNTLYMASANPQAQVITIEGSKSLVDLAASLAKKLNRDNIRFVHATFDEALPTLLDELPVLDLLYVDGNHTYEATLRYFELALSRRHDNSVFVFDDIYWSPGMTRAWEKIKSHPSVTLSIDSFYFGMVFFRKEIREPVSLKLYI